jgi:hypothetical protein
MLSAACGPVASWNGKEDYFKDWTYNQRQKKQSLPQVFYFKARKIYSIAQF